MQRADQIGRTIDITVLPGKIVSLVPSQTELLYHLGLEEEVAGITKFCIHPREWFARKTHVGGTKTLDLPLIRRLQPDLILANKEENVRGQLEALMEEFPVWVSNVNDLHGALNMIRSVGEITGCSKAAQNIASRIETAFAQLGEEAAQWAGRKKRLSVAYFIWRKPWMVAGNDTFIHDMLQHCGLQNHFRGLSRYPEIALSSLQDSPCDAVLLSSEPFPFREKHAEEIRQVLPGIKIFLVDGEPFSWYGSRLLKSPDYFRKLRIRLKEL